MNWARLVAAKTNKMCVRLLPHTEWNQTHLGAHWSWFDHWASLVSCCQFAKKRTLIVLLLFSRHIRFDWTKLETCKPLSAYYPSNSTALPKLNYIKVKQNHLFHQIRREHSCRERVKARFAGSYRRPLRSESEASHRFIRSQGSIDRVSRLF